MKNRFLDGERKKMVSESTKDYFLLNDKIYPVNTMTQRAKLQSLKQFIEFQDEFKPIPTPIRRPTAPQINLKQQLTKLTIQQKKTICSEIQHNLNIKSNPFLKRLESQMATISRKIQQQTNINKQMLNRLQKSGQLTPIECQNKMEFFSRLLERKNHFIQSITKLFTNIFTKEINNDQGQITIGQLLYSHNSLSLLGSVENIKSQDQITSEKDLLMKQISSKLDLVTNFDSFKKKQDDKSFSLECQETIPKLQLTIPLIMTKDRKQQIQKQQAATRKKLSECQIQHRIAMQLSLIPRTKQLQQIMVDTSLASVGNYLTKLNTYILNNYFDDIIQLINMPFGKPAIQRLSELRGQYVGQDILPVILSQKLFDQFQSHIDSNQNQKIHHRVLFDCLNQALNIYRPYFNFQGEIYPWLTTQKGMTFYSISQSNIEQVVDKCKITIMQKAAATLCGVLSEQILDQKTYMIFQQKRKDRIQKMVQQDIVDLNWLQSEDMQAKMMLNFSTKIVDWLIQQTVFQMRSKGTNY